MNLSELAPCVPPLGIPPGWFFAGASVTALLLLTGAAYVVSGWLADHYGRARPLWPRVGHVEAWHAHLWVIDAEAKGEGVAKCGCGALAAVFVGDRGGHT